MVPNCGISWSTASRRGRLCSLKSINKKCDKTTEKLIEGSFQRVGPKLFNSIPADIRNLTNCTVEEFKFKLDLYLNKVPDEPKVDGLTPSACDQFTGKPSNSIIDQARKLCMTGGG